MNAPWVAVKAFNWFQSLVPERFSRKLVLLDGDGTADPDFLDLVGESQLKHLLATRVGLLSGEDRVTMGDRYAEHAGMGRKGFHTRSTHKGSEGVCDLCYFYPSLSTNRCNAVSDSQLGL